MRIFEVIAEKVSVDCLLSEKSGDDDDSDKNSDNKSNNHG